jgi:mono/diheme cytochrome c family protein
MKRRERNHGGRIPKGFRRTQSRWDCRTSSGLPSLFAIRHASFIILITLAVFATGCDWMPGKPTLAHRWAPDTAETNFTALYNLHCAGCHAGGDRRLAAARPMDDPVYLAFADPTAFRRAISNGVPGTAMPAFAQSLSGPLTEAQIEAIAANLLAKPSPPPDFSGVKLPPYAARAGDAKRGAAAYQTYCASCHGAEGKGGEKGGSVVDPSYLALVSDQGLRTAVIAGRVDLGMPDWRGYVPGRSMSDAEIADVVAWLVSHRNQ